jgi:hypothetical protein
MRTYIVSKCLKLSQYFSALAFIPKSQNHAILVAYLIGKGASGAGFQMVWIYTNELYPTNLRGQVQKN